VTPRQTARTKAVKGGKVPAKRATAQKTSTRTPLVKKAGARTAPVRKTAARRTPASKSEPRTAPVGTRVARTAIARTPPGKPKTAAVRTILEQGPKGKKSVAFAVDWPGWSRGAKTSDDALATLESYRERYRPIAVAAGMAKEFDAARGLRVVEERIGTGSTDFWGISFSPSSLEQEQMDEGELNRKITLLSACWSYFDGVAARVSADMRKGPRGGGRDRDEIVRHTIRVESEDFAKRLGLRIPEGAALTPSGRRDHRVSYIAAMRRYHAGEGTPMRSWTLPFLIRHSAFHVMDHAWEMEDKDLS
jgi:hypothetical protein